MHKVKSTDAKTNSTLDSSQTKKYESYSRHDMKAHKVNLFDVYLNKLS